MGQRLVVDLLNYRFHLVDHLVYTRLQVGIIVLNIVNELGEAPECVGLGRQELFDAERADLF